MQAKVGKENYYHAQGIPATDKTDILCSTS